MERNGKRERLEKDARDKISLRELKLKAERGIKN